MIKKLVETSVFAYTAAVSYVAIIQIYILEYDRYIEYSCTAIATVEL